MIIDKPTARRRDPGQLLAWGYMAALGLIAALTIGSHVLMIRIVERQKETSEIVYMAGRQRMLSQQIAQYGSRYNRRGDEADHQKMIEALDKFEQGHRFLTRLTRNAGANDNDLRPMPPELYNVYYAEPFHLDEAVRDYIDNARVYAGYDHSDPDPRRIKTLDYISEQATGHLTKALDEAMKGYQRVAAQEVRTIERWQLGLTLFVLVVLLSEAVFIFRPMVRYVNRYSRTLNDMAMRDVLTVLHNRRSFNERVDEMMSDQVCIVLTDIDKFKSVNDTYGHDVGDRVLRHFAQIIGRAIRDDDLAARLGGEEFVIILPRTSAEDAFAVIERLRKTVENTPCGYATIGDSGREMTLNYTASFGIASAGANGTTAEELLKAADTALYKAKEGGRNRVETA